MVIVRSNTRAGADSLEISRLEIVTLNFTGASSLVPIANSSDERSGSSRTGIRMDSGAFAASVARYISANPAHCCPDGSLSFSSFSLTNRMDSIENFAD
jgi:hypothetical protein